MNDSDSSTRLEPADAASLLELYLERRDEGGRSSAEDLIDLAGEDADELRGRLAVLGELEQLSLLLSEDQGSVPDDLQQLGRFERMRLIGQGGLSKVFFAHDPRLGRDVALKVLSPASLDNDVRDLMLAEGRSLARLEHDSIVRVFEIDEVDGFAYIAMERIVGPSLHDTLEVMRALLTGADETTFDARTVTAARRLESVPARCRLIAELARALEYCHEKGTVHRDIKPGNILIDESGTPKLIDFGLAHLESEGEASLGLTQKLVGTPAYITPEQVDQKRTGVSPGSDQFSLGIVLYELLTLVNPFNKDTREDTLTAISKASPPPLRKFVAEIPVDVERVCLHCLERQPAERYTRIGQLADDLEAFLDYRAVSVQAPSLMRLTQLWLRRNNEKVRTAGLVSVALITALSAAGIWRARAARSEVTERVQTALARVPELAQPDEVEVALDDVIAMRQEAARYDDTVLSGLLLPALGGHIQELADATSLRLNVLATADFEAAREATRSRQETAYLTALSTWNPALHIDGKANPASTLNALYRQSGRVSIPPGGILRLLDEAHPIQNFVETNPDGHLEQGFYRFSIEEGDEIRESEFYLRLWHEYTDRTPQRLDDDLRDAMVLCAGGTKRYEDEVSKNVLEYRQEPFRVSPDLVTWADVARVLGDDWVTAKKLLVNRSKPPAGRLSSEAPAILFVEEAVEYALRVGARLPTVPELVMAYEMGSIEGQTEYELTSSFTRRGEMRGIVEGAKLHTALEGDGPLEPADFLSPIPDAAVNARAGFRLVLSESARASGLR